MSQSKEIESNELLQPIDGMIDSMHHAFSRYQRVSGFITYIGQWGSWIRR